MSKDFELAGRGSRLVAVFIDGIAVGGIMAAVMWYDGIFERVQTGEKLSFEEQAKYASIGWIIFFALQGLLLFFRGQTFGKFLLAIKIVNEDGSVPNFFKLLFLRYLLIGFLSNIRCLGGILGLIDIMMIFGEERRCLHDLLAGTYVIEA